MQETTEWRKRVKENSKNDSGSKLSLVHGTVDQNEYEIQDSKFEIQNI